VEKGSRRLLQEKQLTDDRGGTSNFTQEIRSVSPVYRTVETEFRRRQQGQSVSPVKEVHDTAAQTNFLWAEYKARTFDDEKDARNPTQITDHTIYDPVVSDHESFTSNDKHD
jgi:hypothetical protein